MSDRGPIAIVGLACRFPGAPNVPAFWRLLAEGRCAIREVPADRWDVEAYFAPEPATPGRMNTRHGGFLDELDRFDPAFFGLSPREADAMDPQQRLLLELAWEAFEDAGIPPPKLTRSRTGVFMGISSQDYARLQLSAGITPDAYAGTGNAACIASNRISYTLDLRGPSISVDTACSSSLTAIHLAAESIRRGESELAIAGGVNAILAPDLTITFSQARMMAADGLCKTFDARADGYVRSEGAGIIVLERLEDAIANGHPIRAILAASAVSQDGRSNGLTAPNGPSQEAVIEAALAAASLEGCSIDYVEAHGTGTPLGDPIELKALASSLGKNRDAKLRVGSVKTNLGHLEAAAGVAGVIKTVLALEHQAIPAHLHFQTPNPHIDWEQLPITIPTELQPWPRSERARRAGVSSFGFGGTNAHLVLEEAPSLCSNAEALPVVAISARSKEALAEDAKHLTEWIASQPDLRLAELSSACASRTGLPERIAVWGTSPEELARGLSAFAEGRPSRSVASGRRSLRRAAPVAFLFPGQGARLAGLGRGLYEAEPIFRRALDRAAAAVDRTFDRSLLQVLFEADEDALRRTELAQPILFAVGHALAETWAAFGVVPDVVLGHSLGELTAATVAGALELEAAAAFVVARGRLMQRCRGAMAAVLGDEATTRAELSDGVELAAYNGPDQLTISGSSTAIQAASERLSAAGLSVHRLATDHPFHSAAIDALQEELAEAAAKLGASAPSVALVSSWSGARVDALAEDHFVRQAREPVRFGAALQAALDLGPSVLIEMGPSSLLSMSRRAIPDDRTACSSLSRAGDDALAFAEALGTAYAGGVDVDWTRVARHPFAAHVPPRSYQRRRCWFDPEAKGEPIASAATEPTSLLGRRIASPLSSELYESQLSAERLPFLTDHRVHGAMVLPATAYVEAAASARPGHTLEDVRFEGALLVADGETRSIQTIVEPDGSGGARFMICSQATDGSWVRHGAGRAAIASDDRPNRIDLDVITARLPEVVETTAHYQRLAARGLEYGPSFQGVTSLRRRDGEALGEVRTPDADARHHFHPAALDACLQVVAAALPAGTWTRDSHTFLPVRIERYRAFASPPAVLVSHAVLRGDVTADADTFESDVCITDTDGNVVAELRGFRLMRLERTRAEQNLHHRLMWTAIDASSNDGGALGTWMVLGADDTAFGRSVRAELTARGATIRDGLDIGDAPSDLRTGSAATSVLDLTDLEREGGPDEANTTVPAAHAEGGAKRALALARRLATSSARLFAVTRDAEGSAASAAIWGALRAFALEHPDRFGALIDVDDTVSAESLVAALVSAGRDDELRLRGAERQVPRLEPVRNSTCLPARLRADATYLISGGLGALGLQVAERFVREGARSVVLLARRRESEAQRSRLDAMRALGANVRVANADVADPEALAAALEHLTELPPIRGVVHAAGVARPQPIAQVTDEELARTFAGKVHGAWNLERAVGHLPLDFFVLFSSISAVWGSRDLATYAAANHALHSLAAERRRAGRPAISLAFGPWDGGGMAEGRAEELRRVGLNPLPPSRALDAMFEAMASTDAHRVIADADWTKLAGLLGRPALSGFAPTSSATSSFELAELVTLDPPARRDAVIEELRRRFARVLRSEPELVPLDEPLTRLGIDSLMAVELRNGVEADLGVSIPLVKLLGGPTVRELAAVLEEGLRSRGSEPTDDAMRPVRVSEPDRTDFELSLGQRALWFVQRLDPSSSAYNISGAVRIKSALDVEALGCVFQRLVDRHAALRTTLPAPGGQPIQRIHASMRADFEVRELQGDLQAALTREAHRPFDLEQGPLFRARVFREPAGTHVLLVAVHHTVADFWSLVVLIDEVGKLYGSEVRGESASLPALPLEYTDWARWQSDRISGRHGDALWAYWREQLTGELPVLDLPTDRPRPAVQGFRGASTTLELDRTLAAGLRELGERHGATLYMTLLAAFSALLARYGGQDEALVGSPVAGRDHSDLTGLVGYFVNPVVVRSRLDDDPSFEALLERTRDAALGAFEHHELPFATLVERLRPPRTASHSPIFQAMFVLQKAQSLDDQGLTPFVLREAGHTMTLGELQVESVSLEHRVAQFDLTLTAVEKDGGISASLEFNTDLFDAATAERMLASLRTLVAGIVEDPTRPVRALPLVGDDAIDPLAIGAGPMVPLTPRTVHGAILEAAGAAGDRTALVHRDRKVTFGELADSSQRLAERLIEAGVVPGARVAVFMERSIDMVTALVAVMRAGAAYVPVDPTYPAPRVAQILEDASAAAIVADTGLTRRAGELGIPVVVAQTTDASSTTPLPTVQPSALAYVLYTSGSTGRPKGVMVRHDNVTAFFTAMDALLGAREPRTWAAVTSIAFDISVLELLYSLASGDTVVIIDDAKAGLGIAAPRPRRPVELSLFYFANDDGDPAEAYQLLLDGARFADEHGFAAVWTPERHFHAFGGLYPNPAVTSAALATITKRVRLRAGSVVLPLHHPVRVAEEWALVDQLSGGRVDLAIASGWQPSDFVFAPGGYQTRREDTREGVEQLRRLWRGETLTFPGGAEDVDVRIHPRPVQAELPLWITCAGSPDTFRWAGSIGANVLTHLLGQSREELREKLAVYREARREAGHSGPGHVTLMIHTFLAEDAESVRETVRAPLERYLRSSAELMRSLAGPGDAGEVPDSIVARAFDRYFESSGLFGSAESVLPLASEVAALGVDELACLVDFGVSSDRVRASFEQLAVLRDHLDNFGHQEDRSLATQLEQHGVTHLQCTPSLMTMLLEDARTARALGGISQLLLGGEALPASLAERVTRACPRARVFNMYGPTETTVWSTAAEVVADAPITIGRPLANTTAYVLDAGGSPVPVGVPGELHLAGAGVSEGYLGQLELTRARFVNAPGAADAKMYGTGDLVRWRPDRRPGAPKNAMLLEFLGRTDQQIKLRGARIEIGEIEHALESHPSVLRAGVSLRTQDGHARLVAHVVSRTGIELELSALRAHVKASLPDVMVPASILAVEALPQTPNGKLDRGALARLDVGDAPGRAYVGPRNELEQRIADIWAEVLPTKRIGVHDNFFELGGDSILSIRIITRARERGMSVAPAMLFRHQTIAELAEVVRVVEPTPVAPAPVASLSGLDRAALTKVLARVQRAKLRRAANDSGHAERTGEDS